MHLPSQHLCAVRQGHSLQLRKGTSSTERFCDLPRTTEEASGCPGTSLSTKCQLNMLPPDHLPSENLHASVLVSHPPVPFIYLDALTIGLQSEWLALCQVKYLAGYVKWSHTNNPKIPQGIDSSTLSMNLYPTGEGSPQACA